MKHDTMSVPPGRGEKKEGELSIANHLKYHTFKVSGLQTKTSTKINGPSNDTAQVIKTITDPSELLTRFREVLETSLTVKK